MYLRTPLAEVGLSSLLSLSGTLPTGPLASTSGMDSANNNGGAGVGSDSQTLSNLQASVKLLSDQMAWFVDKLKEPEAELDSGVIDGSLECSQPEEGEIVEALTELGNAYADITNLGNEVDGQLATIVNNILNSRMTDDKLKEKMEKFVRASNCDKLDITRVNSEIWDKLPPKREHVIKKRSVCKNLLCKRWSQ